MIGQKCPECNNEVMSFKDFFRKAEPNKKFICTNCGTELMRSNLVWLLITICIVLLALSLLIVNLQEWTISTRLLSSLSLIIIFLVLIKFFGWKFVVWQRVDSNE